MKRKPVVNKILVLLSVVFVLCIASLSVYADSINESGKCGPNLTWELTGTVGDMDGYLTLSISGTGAMTSSPWNDRAYIKKVVLEEGLTNIVDYAFSGCENLTSIVIPSGVETIGIEAFFSCENLMSVTLPEGIDSIGDEAFYECYSLKSLAIPESVKTIGSQVFYYCSSLKKLVLPSNLKDIPKEAFSGCGSLASINIPNTVKTIGEGAFGSCHSLEEINIPDSVEIIENWAFSGCKSAGVLSIPNKVKMIGEGAFQACENITDAVIPYGITDIPAYLFTGCTKLSSVTIPESAITIGEKAFMNCSSLETLEIPKSVQSFGWNVFENSFNVTIYGYSGSAAEDYAKENKILFIPIDVVQKNLADADITVMDAKYTGSALKPTVEVILDGDLLDEGKDYTTTYSNNVNAGKGNVKVTGKGDYTGSAKATFRISPASISGATISGVKDKVYTGKALTQAIIVKVGSRILKSGTDYIVSYNNNKNVGTATLTVKGKGNYTGSLSKSFKILPKATGISNIVLGKKSFSLQWKKQATQTNGYIIQYSTDKNFKKDVKNKKITNVNTTKATISGLSGNRTYYVRICTFKVVNGKTYSSAWSKSKTVKTKN